MAWINESGLPIRFGRELAESGHGGQFTWVGPNVEYEFDVIWDELEAFGTVTFLARTVRVPDGLLLKSASFTTTQAFTSGGAATLTLGFHNADGTAYDADGIDATIALTAIDTVGETVTCDGALVGALLANGSKKYSYVTATVGTADYTAGKGKLRLTFINVDGGSSAPLNA